MKPYFNDDFSKMLIERSLSGMTGKTSYGTCPICGKDPCECVNLVEETVELEEVKKDGKDDNGFDSCWKGYKKVGTKIKGGKEVNDCVKAGYEMEGDEEIVEKAPPGAKYERMVKHIKKGYSKDGLSDKEKSIAYATAWKAKNKAVKEEKEDESKAEEEKEKKMSKSAKEKHEKAEDKKEKEMKEARNLPGNQEKIDANKNGKVDAHDFAILRNRKSKKTVKEMWELAAEAKANIEVMPEIDDRDPGNVKKKEKKEKEEKGDK